LRGFLGLTGYYRKFVKNYGKLAVPLTTLLKNNAFTWTLVVDQSFHALKEALCMTHVLALTNFTKNFVLECDASSKGIRAVLMQDGRPLAFTNNFQIDIWANQSMKRKCWLFCMLGIYGILIYCGKRFQIKIDHRSLKYFLEQIISSPKQQKWVTKILRYDYEIIYKKGKYNVLVDALS
jgi:hypothetical protein